MPSTPHPKARGFNPPASHRLPSPQPSRLPHTLCYGRINFSPADDHPAHKHHFCPFSFLPSGFLFLPPSPFFFFLELPSFMVLPFPLNVFTFLLGPSFPLLGKNYSTPHLLQACVVAVGSGLLMGRPSSCLQVAES